MSITLSKIAERAERLDGLGITRRIPRQSKPSIQEQFEEYHAENPEVYELLVVLARDVKRRGYSKYSMKAVYERARWHMNIDKGDSEFKLNNNYHSRYARLIMEQEPDMKGFFKVREKRNGASI